MCKTWTDQSVATWTPQQPPTCEPDYISASGSRYVLTREGVYRYSDHWGRVATCCWSLPDGATCWTGWAFCPWSTFAQWLPLTCLHAGRAGCELSAGETVSVLHAPRDRRGREWANRIQLTVARVTSDYVVDPAGRRFAKSTLRAAYAAGGAA